jgi:DNA invertase Pin-like site-specific DNA recombinase
VKRAALYLRVSTAEQSPESQLQDLRALAEQRGLVIVDEYTDHGVSGAKTSRPALDRLLADARRGKFDVLAIWAFDRLARSVSHLIRLLDELNDLGIEFVSFREAIDTHGPLGRAITVILGAIGELERSIIRERVCAGIRRARRQGRRLGRHPVALDRAAMVQERRQGASLRQLATRHHISKSTAQRVLAEASQCPKNPAPSL